jgi:hypothetical protein
MTEQGNERLDKHIQIDWVRQLYPYITRDIDLNSYNSVPIYLQVKSDIFDL